MCYELLHNFHLITLGSCCQCCLAIRRYLIFVASSFQQHANYPNLAVQNSTGEGCNTTCIQFVDITLKICVTTKKTLHFHDVSIPSSEVQRRNHWSIDRHIVSRSNHVASHLKYDNIRKYQAYGT